MDVYFRYGEKEIDYLKRRDKRLAAVIDRIGPIERMIDPDLFSALVNSIIGQQISTKAHRTVWNRMVNELREITPGSIDGLPAEELQRFGMTFRKAENIKSVARKIKSGEFDIDALHAMPDEEVCARLCGLQGVGEWTAQMLMIFSMQRPDVLSYGDLAILRGLRMVYRHRKIDKAKFDKYRKRYSPHASVASLYLWAVAGGAIEELKDHATEKKNG